MEDHIIFDSVVKQFHSDNGLMTAVNGLTFTVRRGEVVALVGKTGCGKSTTFGLMVGLEPPTQGRVVIGGKDPYRDFAAFRSMFGMVFQTDRLLPWRTAVKNVALGLEILGRSQAEGEQIAREWLGKVGLAGFEYSFPHQLSGGMRQRVSIARAFCTDPEILLCDEAFGHLDQVTANKLRQAFLELVRATGKTAVVITHNISEAVELGQRILVLGKPAQVLWEAEVPKFSSPVDKHAFEQRILQVIDQNEAPVVLYD